MWLSFTHQVRTTCYKVSRTLKTTLQTRVITKFTSQIIITKTISIYQQGNNTYSEVRTMNPTISKVPKIVIKSQSIKTVTKIITITRLTRITWLGLIGLIGFTRIWERRKYFWWIQWWWCMNRANKSRKMRIICLGLILSCKSR